jgi:hypothetical protein
LQLSFYLKWLERTNPSPPPTVFHGIAEYWSKKNHNQNISGRVPKGGEYEKGNIAVCRYMFSDVIITTICFGRYVSQAKAKNRCVFHDGPETTCPGI